MKDFHWAVCLVDRLVVWKAGRTASRKAALTDVMMVWLMAASTAVCLAETMAESKDASWAGRKVGSKVGSKVA